MILVQLTINFISSHFQYYRLSFYFFINAKKSPTRYCILHPALRILPLTFKHYKSYYSIWSNTVCIISKINKICNYKWTSMISYQIIDHEDYDVGYSLVVAVCGPWAQSNCQESEARSRKEFEHHFFARSRIVLEERNTRDYRCSLPPYRLNVQ